MSLSATTTKISYPGPGGTVFTFPYPVQAAGDIEVYRTDLTTGDITGSVLVLNTDYTLTGVGGASCTVTLTADLGSFGLFIRRVVDITQDVVLENGGVYYPKIHERQFDKLTMIDQQQQEQLGRSLHLPESLSGVSTALPLPVARAALAWNATGDGIGNLLGESAGTLEDAKALTLAALASTGDPALGDALVGVKSILTGGTASTQHIKNWASVSIVDFMTAAQWDAWQADQAGYDMAPYLQAAINALTVGGEIYCPPGQYRLTTAINMTASSMAGRAVYGIRIYGAGDRATVFNLVHTGHGFDCTGAQFVNFEKFGVTGNAVTIPKTAFLFARNNTHNSAGQCRLLGVGVRGTYSVACLYNYAAEEFRTQNCWFYNSHANTPAVVHTDDNIAGVTSTFVTIDTGHQSNTEFRHIGTSIASDQPTGTAAALVIRGVLAFTFRDGFMVQTPGAGSKYVQIDASLLSSGNLTFDNIMIDASSAGVEKFIYQNGTLECSKITINQILAYGLKSAATGGFVYYADTGASTTGTVMTALPSGSAVHFYAVTTSDLSLPNEKLEIAYSSSNNRVLVKFANVTLTRPDLAVANSWTYSDYGSTTPNLRSGAGSPYTVVTPLFLGEQYVDTATYTGNTSTATVWTAIGLTNGYWVPSASLFCHGTGSPVGVVTPGFRGQEYLDDSTSKWWKSYGTLNSQWGQVTN